MLSSFGLTCEVVIYCPCDNDVVTSPLHCVLVVHMVYSVSPLQRVLFKASCEASYVVMRLTHVSIPSSGIVQPFLLRS